MKVNAICRRLSLALIMVFVAIIAHPANSATLLPPGEQVFLDANGKPLAGGSVYFYIPGTTTPKTTWTNSAQTIQNTNPVVLDSAGRAIVYGSGVYRQQVYDSLNNLIWDQVTSDTSATSTAWGGTSGGSANAQTVTAAGFSNQSGQSINFIAGFTNSGSASLNPNGGGPINILKDLQSGSTSLGGGEIVAGNLVEVVYDSGAGAFHLVALPPANFGVRTSLASATTTDLGTVPSHNVNVTGTTTITSFGNTANTSTSIYQVCYAGSLTLTYNGTSLILPGSQNIITQAGDCSDMTYLGSGNWVMTNFTAAAQVAQIIPTGAIMPFAAATVPPGWLEANGACVSRTSYSALYALVGTNYGLCDGSTTFGVPDYRGMFLRGWDHSAGWDASRTITSTTATVTVTSAAPGVVTWTAHGFHAGQAVQFTNSGGALPTGLTAGTVYYVASNSLNTNTFVLSDTIAHALAGSNNITTSSTGTGTQTGTAPVNIESDAVGPHTHQYNVNGTTTGGGFTSGANSFTYGNATAQTTTGQAPSGTTETRPINMPVMYGIKT